MPNLAPYNLVTDLSREFIRIPSPSGAEQALADCVAGRMEALGFRVERDSFGDVLGIRQGGSPGPTLLLDAHMDTVPVTDPSAWTHAPFGAEIAQGRLWGRGSADTKGSLAAMIGAAAGLDPFPGTIIVSASVCEENLTGAALRHILASHPADVVLVGEPTSLLLGIAQKGRAGILVEALGRSAHSSRPELGDNAVTRMMEALARLRTVSLPSDPELGRGVCELIEIASEPKASVGMVPHRCTARLALRLLPGETAHAVLERTRAGLGGLDGVSVHLESLTQTCCTGLPLAMAEFIPAWKNQDPILQSRLLEALGTSPFAAPYTTNASAAAALGIPVFLLGPGSIAQAHTVDEWIDLEQLNAAAQAYEIAIRTCLGA